MKFRKTIGYMIRQVDENKQNQYYVLDRLGELYPGILTQFKTTLEYILCQVACQILSPDNALDMIEEILDGHDGQLGDTIFQYTWPPVEFKSTATGTDKIQYTSDWPQ